MNTFTKEPAKKPTRNRAANNLKRTMDNTPAIVAPQTAMQPMQMLAVLGASALVAWLVYSGTQRA